MITIPDSVYGGIIPTVAGLCIWVGSQFVRSVRSDSTTTTTTSNTSYQHPVMTVADYRQLSTLLKDELNGRYMFADEAREKFFGLESKIQAHADEAQRTWSTIESKVEANTVMTSSSLDRVTNLLEKCQARCLVQVGTTND